MNPYKHPPDNPLECPCCRAASHWDSVYEKGWNAGANFVALLFGALVVLAVGAVVARLVQMGAVNVPGMGR